MQVHAIERGYLNVFFWWWWWGERVVTVIFLLLHLSASDHVHSIHLTLLSNSLPCVSVTLVREEDETLGMGFPGGPEAYLLWKGPSSWSQTPLPAISGATCRRGPSRCSAAWMRSADHACQGLRPPVGTASPSPLFSSSFRFAPCSCFQRSRNVRAV